MTNVPTVTVTVTDDTGHAVDDGHMRYTITLPTGHVLLVDASPNAATTVDVWVMGGAPYYADNGTEHAPTWDVMVGDDPSDGFATYTPHAPACGAHSPIGTCTLPMNHAGDHTVRVRTWPVPERHAPACGAHSPFGVYITCVSPVNHAGNHMAPGGTMWDAADVHMCPCADHITATRERMADAARTRMGAVCFDHGAGTDAITPCVRPTGHTGAHGDTGGYMWGGIDGASGMLGARHAR